MTLTQLSKAIQTILPDGTPLKTFIEMGGTWSDGEHRMGEKKRITLEYTTSTSMSGCNVYVNPALFMNEGAINTITGKGSYFYGCALPAVLVDGVEYNFSPQTINNPADTPATQNYTVKLVVDGYYDFTLIIDFFMIEDVAGYMYPKTNNPKLLKYAASDPYPLAPDNSNIASMPSANNVYSTAGYSPRVYIYIENPSVPFPGDNATVEEKFIGFGAGWYRKNKYNAVPWFTNTYFDVKRDGVSVTNLADYRDSDVEIYANTDSSLNPVTHFMVLVIRTDKIVDSVDFYTNYEADFQLIVPANLASGKIAAPMTGPTDMGSNQWKGTFVLKGLTYGAKYRLIGIAYSSLFGQPYRVNSFISGEYTVDAVPQYIGNGMVVRASLDDYNKQYEGHNLQCCIEERMRSKVKLDFPFNKWKNDIYTRFGLTSSNDIREFLTAVKVEIFEEYFDTKYGLGTIRNIYDTKTSNNGGVSGFSPQTNMTLSFANTWAEFTYQWRNRFEVGVPAMQTLVNGVNYTPIIGNQYWGGKTLTVRWTFSFYYKGYSRAFYEDIVVDQFIRVKDYGEMSVKTIQGEDYTTQEVFCNDQEMCFAGILQNPSLPDRKLIVNIMPVNGTVLNIEEAEEWKGIELPQLQSDKIINEEEDYDLLYSETAAKFCLDGTKLVVNSQYQISALAKKYKDTGFRITELLDQRITENINPRTTDKL